MKKKIFILSTGLNAFKKAINLKLVLGFILFGSILQVKAQGNFYATYNCQNLSLITAVAISDDGFDGFMAVVSGYNTTGNEIINLIKLDDHFNVLWTKSIDYSLSNMNLLIKDIKRYITGGYAICGKYFNINYNYNGGFVMRIDNNGNIIWFKNAREIYNTDRCEELNSVEIIGNHYVSCGYSIDNGNPKNGFIWSIDKNTQVVEWTRTETSAPFPGNGYNPYNVVLKDVVYNPADGMLYTCGSWYDANNINPKEIVLASYDLNGNIGISQKYTDNNVNLMEGIAISIDGQNIYVTGNITTNSGSDDILIACIQSNGTMLWSNKLDIANRDKVNDIIFFDNQLYFTGSTEYQNREGLILKTDIYGNPVFSALYSIPQYSLFEFHKMLYRNTFTNPSIIKIGFYNTTNILSIAETYIAYNQGCSDEPHAVNLDVLSMQQSDVSYYHTKEDFNSFDPNSPISIQTYEDIICQSLYFTISPKPKRNSLNKSSIINTENNEELSVFNDQIIIPSAYNKLKFKLYSIDGRLIEDGFVINNCINISSLKKGIYLLYLQSTNNTYKTIKIVR
jgi:hypothetical protein